jgi:hypothetical protein
LFRNFDDFKKTNVEEQSYNAAKHGYLSISPSHIHKVLFINFVILGCLKYLKIMGCKFSKATHEAAASGGNLDTLQFLHESGCDLDDRACEYAAQGGHLDCLIFLHNVFFTLSLSLF